VQFKLSQALLPWRHCEAAWGCASRSNLLTDDEIASLHPAFPPLLLAMTMSDNLKCTRQLRVHDRFPLSCIFSVFDDFMPSIAFIGSPELCHFLQTVQGPVLSGQLEAFL